LLLLASLLIVPIRADARTPRVFRVCNKSTEPCSRGGHRRDIARVLKRLKPGDWLLIWPGVYHLLREPDERRPGERIELDAAELLLRQHRPERAHQRAADDRDRRRPAVRPAGRRLRRARRGARLRRRHCALPARLELPAADAGADDAAVAPDADARPVRGRAEEPVVPVHGTAVVSPLRSGRRGTGRA